jgi:hypothetical protein
MSVTLCTHTDMSVPAVTVLSREMKDPRVRLKGPILMALRPLKESPLNESPLKESNERDPVVIDCDDCAVRGPGCRDCVVSVLLGVPETLLEDERAALQVLADVGLAPRLRLVPIRRNRGSGVA